MSYFTLEKRAYIFLTSELDFWLFFLVFLVIIFRYCSVHRFGQDKLGQFYPGTGTVDSVGEKKGKGYNINMPFHNRGILKLNTKPE